MIQKIWTFLDEKNLKITKRAHAFKGYANSCNYEVLNACDPELHLKNAESTIKNKLKNYWLNQEDLSFW